MENIGAARSELFDYFFFSSRRRHTISDRDWSSDVCSSDLDANLHDDKGNARRAGEELRKLQQGDGVGGNRQAESKKELQSAEKAAAPTAGGFGKFKDESGKEVEARTVQNVGRRTFYQKKNVWQEADVPENVEAKVIKYYS